MLDVIATFRTECGVISANEILEKFAKYVVHNRRDSVAKIMSWRDSRTDFGFLSDMENTTIGDVKTTKEN